MRIDFVIMHRDEEGHSLYGVYATMEIAELAATRAAEDSSADQVVEIHRGNDGGIPYVSVGGNTWFIHSIPMVDRLDLLARE